MPTTKGMGDDGENVLKGSRPKNGKLPMDKAMVKALDSHDFKCCLTPLPGGRHGEKGKKRSRSSSSSGSSSAAARKSKKKNKSKANNDLKSEVGRLRQELQVLKGGASSWPGAGGKAKGKGKGQFRDPPMPKALLPGKARNSNNEPLCFGYNLGTCKKCAPGQKCDKGVHACTKLGCIDTHTAYECKS